MKTEEIKQKIEHLRNEISISDKNIQTYRNEVRLLERDLRKAKEKECKEKYSKLLNKYFHYSYIYNSKFDVYIYVKYLSFDYDIWILEVESMEICTNKNGHLSGFSYNESTLINLVTDITLNNEVKPEDLKEITKKDFIEQYDKIISELHTLSCNSQKS